MLVCDRCHKEMRHDHCLVFECSGWFHVIRAELCKECHKDMEKRVRKAFHGDKI